MKKRILLTALVLASVLLSGCAPLTVYEMYSLPRRSEEYNDLQVAIDNAMAGEMTYSAPQAGENLQTVQMADLTGDGQEEYLVFAKGSSEKPMKILIFTQDDDGKARLLQIIDSTGSAFEQVEYVDMDGEPGLEIIVGRQVSDQVLRSVSVYGIREGEVQQLMSVGYTRFMTCDLDSDGGKELLVIQPGTEDRINGIAVLYSIRDGVLERSLEAELSQRAESIMRVIVSRLEGGTPAVYIASAVDESSIMTDVLALREGRFANISLSGESGNSVKTLRNYYVYGSDVDSDGVLELPSLIGMYPLNPEGNSLNQYLIRWFSLDEEGAETDKLYSFHNYQGGWYVGLDSQWAHRVTVEQVGNTYAFYLWDEEFESAEPLYTLYALTGSDRETQAQTDGRVLLCSADSVIYAVRLEEIATGYGITEDILRENFHLIYEAWNSGNS
ncbi:MAG: hypothetical protein IJ001_07185 [Oscillospiraceae bacterium]|nr:hypothetical protein [Oscillospiraceae bacterium]